MSEKLKTNVGFLVGIPSRARWNGKEYEQIETRPVLEWSLSIVMQNYPTNLNVGFSYVVGQPRDKAREEIAEHACSLGARYLWFLDDDVSVPFNASRLLVYALENADEKVMVAGGIYCSKTNPPEPLVYQGDGVGAFWKWKVGDIFPCQRIATGCMLIKTEVFKHLPKPWFKEVDENCDGQKKIDGMVVIKEQGTDDMWFCRRVTEAGFGILAHGGVQCIHWDNKTGIPYLLPQDSYPAQKETVSVER